MALKSGAEICTGGGTVRASDVGLVGAIGSLLPVTVRAASSLIVEPMQPAPDSGFYLALCLIAGMGFLIGVKTGDFARAFGTGFIVSALLTAVVGGAMNAAPVVTSERTKVGDTARPPKPSDVGDLIDDLQVAFPGRPTALGDFRWALGAPRYLEPLAR